MQEVRMKYAFDYMEIEIIKEREVKVYLYGKSKGKKYTASLGGSDSSVNKYIDTGDIKYLPFLLLHGNFLTIKLKFIAKEQGVLKFSVTSIVFNMLPIGFESPYYSTENVALELLRVLEKSNV